MIHRALFGSIERFFGVLTEHYSGAFPPWLAPVQVMAIPVAEPFTDYLQEVVKQMKFAGVRAELDSSDDRMQKKIRNAQMQKVPYMLIAGEDDQSAGKVSIRYRNGEQKNSIAISDAIAEIQTAIRERKQV
jgi:threonyl-tRNA synthetase